MGEARKRRLVLIKGGKADVAKTMYVAPERLTNITIQLPSQKAMVLDAIYTTKVDKKNCPTRNSFVLALLEAGMVQFEQFYIEQNAPQQPDIAVDPVADHKLTPEDSL